MSFFYEIKIGESTKAIDVSDSVIDGIRITNGRENLLEPLAQTSATFSVFKEKFYAIYAAVTGSPNPNQASLGAVVTIKDVTSSKLWFFGRISDQSSDADTITFTLIDDGIFRLSAAPALISDATGTWSDYIISLLSAGIPNITFTPASVDFENNLADPDGKTVRRFDKTVTNRLQEVRDVIGSNPTAFGYFFPNDGLIVYDRLNSPISAVDTLTDTDIIKTYSIRRSLSDIVNDVQITYPDASNNTVTWTTGNLTSLTEIGPRSQSRSTLLTNDTDANEVAKALLAAGAPFGWPVVRCTTNSFVLGYTAAQMRDNLKPNSVLDCSAVTVEGFDKYMYVEQVTYTLNRTIIDAELILSSSQYSTNPQLWNQVTGTTEWGDVGATVTWDDLLFNRL